MKKIKIVTGSQASISSELASQFNISIIPYNLNYPDRSLKEGIDIKTEEFYNSLDDIDSLPTSSPPSVGDIQEQIETLNKEDCEIMIFTLSSTYSQMYNSCQQALKNGEYKNVHVIDSKGATAYQAMMVLISAQMALNGESVNEILSMVNDFSDRSDEFLVLNTLKYLAKGGRIGRVKALMSSLISIKPVIVHRDGITAPLAKARTHPQALKIIKDEMKQKIGDLSKPIAVIIQGIKVESLLNQIEQELSAQFNIKTIWRSRFSAITGIHTGPSAWSVTYHIL